MSDEPQRSAKPDQVIDDTHGGHGGGLESEGKPQQQQPEAEAPAEETRPRRENERRPRDTTRHP